MTPTFLLVEDDESDVIFLTRAFSKLDPPVALAVTRDGREAIRYLEGSGDYADRARHPLPGHVLLDLKLPEKSGFEVLEWIRESPAFRDLRVCILTSSSEARDLERARELGADCYLVKPMGLVGLQAIAAELAAWAGGGAVPSADRSETKTGSPR